MGACIYNRRYILALSQYLSGNIITVALLIKIIPFVHTYSPFPVVDDGDRITIDDKKHVAVHNRRTYTDAYQMWNYSSYQVIIQLLDQIG